MDDDLRDATHAVKPGSLVTGIFPDRESAERAYASVADRGYSEDDVNLMMSEETRQKCLTGHGLQTEMGNKAAEGAGIGGAIGTTIGAVAGAVAALGTSLLIPGLGIAVAGPLAVGMAGAGVGGITGGLAGALVGWGIPEERVKEYESGIKNGGIFMALKPKDEQDAEYVERTWRDNKGQHVYH
ncbi:uncharacterized protein NMK_2640 [Novimethylophilus kurashikiensis]|uniref:General stress protein 17M-like domain-containing protein n=1 Tax=Novimethylophilus kurashikiensis TaxID=1825523 RepID=A0A2R5FB45_9PROT|nr:hypothetical protein [Novimethylophilus kurashikiensis]GBG15039.1 uncharacterized protein NMK_2640 [Novimethylophilus kurashikiensis]